MNDHHILLEIDINRKERQWKYGGQLLLLEQWTETKELRMDFTDFDTNSEQREQNSNKLDRNFRIQARAKVFFFN